MSLLTNCKSSTKNEIKLSEAQDTTSKTADIPKVDTPAIDTTAVVDDAVKMSKELINYIDAVHKEFDGLAPTFEAKYTGFDIGDYPHITFIDKKGKEYDFGNGNNTYGKFKEEEIVTEKSKYEGKMFKVTWEWKTSTFLCCDGEMDPMSAKVPSIVNLELVK